jgi:hypothetical protein
MSMVELRMALVLVPAVLAVVCMRIYRRTIFTKIVLLAMLSFGSGFAATEKAPEPIIFFLITIPTLLALFAVAFHCWKKFSTNADAIVWRGRFDSGRTTATGPAARRFWLLATICCLSLAIGQSVVFAWKWQNPEVQPTNATLQEVP